MKTLFVLLVLFVTGCASAVDSFKSASLERVSFEMNCPKDKISFIALEDGVYAKQVGVSGCGQKQVYVWTAQMNAWVLNSDSKPEKRTEK